MCVLDWNDRLLLFAGKPTNFSLSVCGNVRFFQVSQSSCSLEAEQFISDRNPYDCCILFKPDICLPSPVQVKGMIPAAQICPETPFFSFFLTLNHVRVYCSTADRHNGTFSGFQVGFYYAMKTIKALELAFLSLPLDFRFHGYLAPVSSAKCKSEAEGGRQINCSSLVPSSVQALFYLCVHTPASWPTPLIFQFYLRRCVSRSWLLFLPLLPVIHHVCPRFW